MSEQDERQTQQEQAAREFLDDLKPTRGPERRRVVNKALNDLLDVVKREQG